MGQPRFCQYKYASGAIFAWSRLIVAGTARDRSSVVGLYIRRVCLDMTSYSLSVQNGCSGVLKRTNNETSNRNTLSAPGFRTVPRLGYSDYRTIYSQSKAFLIRKRSESDYSSDLTHTIRSFESLLGRHIVPVQLEMEQAFSQ